MIKSQLKIVLASTSPQRTQILKNAGFEFEICAPDYEEIDPPGLSPAEIAKLHAFNKAKSVIKNYPEAVVIGCDTIVCLDNKVIGKANSAAEAREIIKSQQSKSFQVISGLAIFNTVTNKDITKTVTTEITFSKMTDQEIDDYIATNEWKEKSGAFSIQGLGSKYISSINGDFFNVVGLPINELYSALKLLDAI
jgi:septum formation protein